MGRKATIAVEVGQQFGRLEILELGPFQGKRGARVRCTHAEGESPEKWVQLAALASGKIQSCGCQSRESAAQRARERNAQSPPRLGTGKKGLPPGVKYVPVEVPYGSVINDEGRECAYKGEGNCGQQFKPWGDFNKGNGAREHSSWCKACQAAQHKNSDPVVRRAQHIAVRLKAFGLTVEQYRAMEAVHGGRCWLCREHETLTMSNGERQRLGVDHDHACCDFDPTPQRPLCGQCVRGLCCHRCNRQVLGNVEAVGADKVFNYLAGAKVAAQATISLG